MQLRMLCVESMFHEYIATEPLGHIQVYCDTYFITLTGAMTIAIWNIYGQFLR